MDICKLWLTVTFFFVVNKQVYNTDINYSVKFWHYTVPLWSSFVKNNGSTLHRFLFYSEQIFISKFVIFK